MIAFLAGLVFFIAASGQTGLISPFVWNDLYLGSNPPPCVEDDVVRDSLNPDDKGRASGFSLRGTKVCEHILFEPNERDPFYNFIVQQSDLQAKSIAQNLYDQQRSAIKIPTPFQLRVNAANPEIESIVRTSFNNELTSLFGAGSVNRMALDTSSTTELLIDVNRVDSADLLFQITLNYSDEQGLRHERGL